MATGVLDTNGQRFGFTMAGLATIGAMPARVTVTAQVYGLQRSGDFAGTDRDVGGAASDLDGGLRLGNDSLVLIVLRPTGQMNEPLPMGADGQREFARNHGIGGFAACRPKQYRSPASRRLARRRSPVHSPRDPGRMHPMRMWIVALLLVAGCAERWERPGATEAESDAAQAQCTALATRQVPPAMVWTQVAAGYRVPAERRCRNRSDGSRDCTYRPARYEPPRFDWVDVNTRPRREARNACLVENGWTYGGLRPLRLD